MSQVKINTAISNINSGKIKPVYVLYGEEDFFVEQFLEELKGTLFNPGDEDFNLDVYYGSETDGTSIVNAASSFPMMVDTRLVIVKEFHHLNEKSREQVVRYCRNPAQSSCLVLASSKLSKSHKTIKSFAENCTLIETKPLYDNQVAPWIKSQVAHRKRTITDDAIALLQASAGNSLRRLFSELNKIEILIKDKKDIQVQDVERVVGISKEHTIFEFCDAVAEKKVSKSLTILHRLLELGENPTGILVMLNRHFMLLTKAKEMVLKRSRKDDMVSELRINRYFIQKYITQTKQYSRAQLFSIFELLLEADTHLKSSYQKPKLVLESLLFEIYSKT